MKVWTVANQKGGVGKTTTVVSLAGLLSRRRCRTLMVDLDPHGSLSSYFGFNDDNPSRSVYSLFEAAEPATVPVVKGTQFSNLSIITSSPALAAVERDIGRREGMGLVLLKAIGQLRQRFDCVLIDCPPVLGVLMVNALAACTRLIIPVQCDYLALKGLERMLDAVAMIRKANQRRLPYLVVPTFYDRRTKASRAVLETLQHDYGRELWTSTIPVDTQFREASLAGMPLSLMSPRSRGAQAYAALLDQLLLNTPASLPKTTAVA